MIDFCIEGLFELAAAEFEREIELINFLVDSGSGSMLSSAMFRH